MPFTKTNLKPTLDLNRKRKPTELPDRSTAEEPVRSGVWRRRAQHQKQDGTNTNTALLETCYETEKISHRLGELPANQDLCPKQIKNS